MKRITVLTVAAAILTLTFETKVSAQSSVPNLINFQGKLTDNAGNPVPDGDHSLTFRIFDSEVSGPLGPPLWTEGPLGIFTSGGLFNHRLGSSVSLPQTLFQDHDSLYLEIEADGDTLSPRTRLTSNPYTRVAGGLEVRSTIFPNTVAIRTDPSSHRLSIYAGDGLERLSLGNTTFGEILLNDATNDQTVKLSANNSMGGELQLADVFGSVTINLKGGTLGDASVVLRNDAINALEMEGEPGVASNTGTTQINMDGSIQTLFSQTITAPAGGYVLVIATGGVAVPHANGTASLAQFGVSDAAGSFPPNQTMLVQIPSSAPSGTYNQAVTVHGLFSVSPGASTFYFLGQEFSGVCAVSDRQLTLIYFPTAYGTVVPTVALSGENIFDDKVAGQPIMTTTDVTAEQPQKFNAEQIARELAQVKAEMEARMQKLEEQLRQSQEGVEER